MPTTRTTRACAARAITTRVRTTPVRTRRIRTTRILGLLATTGLVVAFTACIPSADDATDDVDVGATTTTAADELAIDPTTGADATPVEQPTSAIETVTPTASVDNDVDAAVDQETTEAAVDLAGEVPADFPDDIPLPPDAEVLSGTSLDDGDVVGFSLVLQPAGSIEDVATDLATRFETSGYTVDDLGEMTSGDVVTHPLRFDRPDWAGTVVIGDNTDGTIAVYSVVAVPG